MDSRKESDLKSCCDSQSERRLSNYRDTLKRDCDDVLFDSTVEDLMDNYIRYPGLKSEVKNYLNNLRDPDGVKFGRSIKHYDSLLETLNQFSKKEVKPLGWNRNFRKAVEKVAKRYAKASLKCLQYHSNCDIVDAISDSRTSAGWTSIIDGYRYKCDFPEEKLLEEFEKRVKFALVEGSFNSYIILFTRTQCSGEFDDDGNDTGTCKHKTRPVWAVDMFTVIAELKWSKPLNSFLKHYKHSAIGKDDNAIDLWVNHSRARSTHWFSVDYSKYDSTIPSWLIHSAFSILAGAFNMSEEEASLLQVLENDFIHKNAITADGVLHADHGNPSGSGLTAIINGICNEIITETWNIAINNDEDLEYMIMGDDNLIFLNFKNVEFKEVCSYISYNFGIECNPDKGSIGERKDNPKFLSREWTNEGPYRHPKVILSKLLFPEHFRNYKKDTRPELVFYSYYLGYKAAMVKLFNMTKFFDDFPDLDKSKVLLSREAVKQMPYNVQVAWAA